MNQGAAPFSLRTADLCKIELTKFLFLIGKIPSKLLGTTVLSTGSLSFQAKPREGEKSQLLSPPADHYNMQLLAHSAQQQQQLLQQQQEQRQQQELFGQGSSSAALQQLAKLHQHGEQAVEIMQDQSSFAVAKSGAFPIYAHGDNVKVDVSGKPIPIALANAVQQPAVAQMSYSSASKQPPTFITNYQNWSVVERATPEFEKGHVRDLSFGSQDSPIFALPVGELVKTGGAKATATPIFQKHSAAILPTVPPNEPEPELKSPLDHPDQLERHRSRFFSSESGAASGTEQQPGDDEAPLNEHDKKAAAAISKLMEQGEKNPPVVPANLAAYKPPSRDVSELNFIQPANPLNILQVQELFRHTPPPTYEQSLLPGATPPGALSIPVSSSVISQTSQATPMGLSVVEVKQEPNCPANKVPSRQYYNPTEAAQNCGSIAMQGELAKYHPGSNVERPAR